MFTQPFIQTQIKENIKAQRHWSLCGNSPGTGEFPAQMASNAENVSIWWRHHILCTCTRLSTTVCTSILVHWLWSQFSYQYVPIWNGIALVEKARIEFEHRYVTLFLSFNERAMECLLGIIVIKMHIKHPIICDHVSHLVCHFVACHSMLSQTVRVASLGNKATIANISHVNNAQNVITLKTRSRYQANFVVAGGTASCHNDNLRYHQWVNKVGIMTSLDFQGVAKFKWNTDHVHISIVHTIHIGEPQSFDSSGMRGPPCGIPASYLRLGLKGAPSCKGIIGLCNNYV